MANDRTERAVGILVDGFMDNPVMGWVFEDEATRAEGLRGYLHAFLAGYGKRGVLEIEAGGEGAALWAEPGTPPLDGEHAASLVEVIRAHNGERTNLVLSTLGAIQAPAEPHWYLNVIAARRGARSRGIGARLLEPYLEKADAAGVGIYLESSNPRNLSFYLRYGFENLGPAIDLPGVGPILQPMLRPPTSRHA